LPIPTGPISYEHTQVFFEITIHDLEIGRIEFELFSKYVPITCNNFRSLCLGDTKDSNDIVLTYKFSTIHKVVKGSGLVGGDITNYDGTGGRSIYSHTFDDENFIYSHEKPYLLCMHNTGPNSNNSKFIITTSIDEAMNGRNVVFGKVIRGEDIIQRIEEEDVVDFKPVDTIVISNCGVLFN